MHPLRRPHLTRTTMTKKNPLKSIRTPFAGQQQGRWWLALLPLILLVAWMGFRIVAGSNAPEWRAIVKNNRGGAEQGALANVSGKPAWLNAGGRDPVAFGLVNSEGDVPQDPRAQHALWTKRLERAETVLENYRRVTRYPHDSRPAYEHGDQMYPNQPILEEKRLFKPGDAVVGKFRLRTSQERVFVAVGESVHFSVAAVDEEGNAVPVVILSSGIVDPPQGNSPSTHPRQAIAFNDIGRDGDGQARDDVWSYRFTPAKSAFAKYTGQLRLDMNIDVGGQVGFTYFDLYYTPDPPAVWAGAVREVIEDGSLNLYLKVQVREAGRYVVSGRFDDVMGKPVSLAAFNEELRAGIQEIRLPVYGKLVHDAQPQPITPLRLRDVEGFLLRENTTPDRALMPRLAGLVHQTKRYAIETFANAEWDSEERTRYLREFQNDVVLAKAKLQELDAKLASVAVTTTKADGPR